MISKPETDNRTYQDIELPNKLQVLLISDPETDKAACALDIHVGSFSDTIPGLAHFCEHLLFMGTEKYPVENEYSQYLSQNGGKSNAYTAGEHTNYYFDVHCDYLEGGLDRFAQFFISPLFLDTCTDREILAVDSEHKKNIMSDSWRVHQLDKDLSNPRHPYSNFCTGNLETLRDEPLKAGIDIRKALLDFHSKYYSSNIMKLVILGKQPIAQLEQWAREKFSSIPNKDVSIPIFPGHPLSNDVLQKLIFIKPIKETKVLKLAFPIPDLRPYYKTQPSQYIAHLIGHEGKGSILSYLKKRGWAQSLSAGAQGGYTGFDIFLIRIELTSSGLDHYEDVILSVFEYVKKIKGNVKKWVFNEVYLHIF